jgi:hypothetical protein
VVPDGIDITTVSLTIQQLTDDNMEEALARWSGRRQLANFDVDDLSTVWCPADRSARPGGLRQSIAGQARQASGLPCITDMVGVDAMHLPSWHRGHGDPIPPTHQ